jgi:hypothetical protein
LGTSALEGRQASFKEYKETVSEERRANGIIEVTHMPGLSIIVE